MANPIERITSKGQLVRLTFSQTDVPGTQSATAIPVEVGGSADGSAMPFDGEVVAIGVRSNADRTAGTATVEATIAGVATGLTAALNATDVRQKHTVQARGSDRFLAGSRVAATLTTASWTPTTADIVVDVWILLYLDGLGRGADS